MPDIFLIGDTSNRGNWGCRATTFQMRAMLGSVGTIAASLDTANMKGPLGPRTDPSRRKLSPGSAKVESAPKAYLKGALGPSLLRSNPTLLGRFGFLLQYATPADLPKLARLISSRKIFGNIADAMERSDAVVINGEGSLLQDRGVGRLKLLLAFTAKTEFGKPVAIVNHTADLRAPALAALAGAVYPLLDDALFREKYSLDCASPLRGDKPFGFAADAAFRFEPLDRDTYARVAGRTDYCSLYPEDGTGFDPARPYICVGGSSAYLNHSADFGALRAMYRDLCVRLSGFAPVVVTASSWPDDVILRPVARELGLPFFGLSTPVQQAVDLLGNAAAYVGGRWHPGILALTGGTPIVSLSANTDFKSKGLTDLVELGQSAVSAFDVAQQMDYLVRLTGDYIEQGDAFRETLRARVLDLRETCMKNVRMISQMTE